MSSPSPSQSSSSSSSFWKSITRASQFVDPRAKVRRIGLGRDEEEEVTEHHRHVPAHGVSRAVDGGGGGNEQDGRGGFLPLLPDDGGAHSTGQIRGQTHGSSNEATPLLGEQGHGEADDADAVDSGAEGEFAPLRSKLDEEPHSRVQEMQRKRDKTRAQLQDDEQDPMLITKVRRDDGTEAEVIIGQSTLGQTIFNSSNTLIGIGVLALPLAFRYAGWVIGLFLLFISSLVTKYTAGLLAKCADVDSSIANFGDIAFVAFGEKGRIATSTLITIEMLLTCVGLVILFADTVNSLGAAGLSLTTWKIICGVILAPLNFIPMRWLGYTSFLGIFCSMAIIITAFVMGFVKQHRPGSLVDVAETNAWPPNWKQLPLSFGLMMALWTGHSVFPNIYRDMRHPPAYKTGLRWVFGFVTSVDLAVGVIGYLLYGPHTLDELTTNIIQTEGYPSAVKIWILVLILILPLTKFPLQCSPILSTLEVLTTIDPRTALLRPTRLNRSRPLTLLTRAAIRLLTTLLVVIFAILIPSFELMAGVLGGLFGYLICVIIPLGFHLVMFWSGIGKRQMVLDWVVIAVSVVMGVVGTVWEFLPEAWIGAGAGAG